MRCRLTTSWGWRSSQGSVCSPVKVVRELGSERRETVRTLSSGIVRILMGVVHSRNLLHCEVICSDTLAKIGEILYSFCYGPRYIQDNTEGRFLLVDKNNSIAYIAGFFDGDGSVRIQLQPRKNASLGYRIRTIISFAQKSGHKKELNWMRKQLGIGYIYSRNDGIDELKIEGFGSVGRVLKILKPHVQFKRRQVKLVLEALDILKKSPNSILEVSEISDKISRINYKTTKKKHTSKAVKRFLSQTN